MAEEEKKSQKRKISPFVWLTCAIVGIALLVFLWWLIWGRFVDATDDAYVHGNQVRLTPQIPGIVVSIHADETQLVEEGQILVELDKTDRLIALEEAKANLANTIRQVTSMFENVYAIAARYEMEQAKLIEAEIFQNDRKEVVQSGAISEEEMIQAEVNYLMQRAALEGIKYDLMKAITQVQNTTVATHPLVEGAKDRVRKTWVDLQRCTLKAPAAGIVAQRRVQVGESVAPSTPLLSIIPLDQMWVNANFKEIALAKIRVGQAVVMHADMYGRKVKYHGYVLGIGGGSGAVFSPLPPQNATGNWIKIVQRVPVRVSLDPQELKKNPLWLGLSMSVDVDVRDQEGRQIPKRSCAEAIYETNVFEDQVDGSLQVIEEILSQNLTFDLAISEHVHQLIAGR